MTGDSRLRRIALGETGFERAAVWSAVGFAVSYVAFDAAGLLGAALAALTAVGTAAFAAVGAGALPAVLLAYGPFAAVFLRAIGPAPYAVPVADPLPFAVAVAEPLGLALAAAVAVGLAGYLVGRVVGGDGDGPDESATAAGGDADASD